jgi:hypothetical protein
MGGKKGPRKARRRPARSAAAGRSSPSDAVGVAALAHAGLLRLTSLDLSDTAVSDHSMPLLAGR